MANGHFTPDFLRFLADLKKHNEREWFMAHKDRYEAVVRDPFLQFIADLAPRLNSLDPRFVADPSPVGGSMMRIYRDIRFARDKSPYKTFVAAHFGRAGGGGECEPVLYLRLEPGKSVIGGGTWRPATAMAERIRHAIAGEPKRWKAITQAPKFKVTFTLAGESLKRLPCAFDAADPHAADLKRKDFIITSDLSDREVTAKDFIGTAFERYKLAAPFMKFMVESASTAKLARSH